MIIAINWCLCVFLVLCSSIMATGGLPDQEVLDDTDDLQSQFDDLNRALSKLSAEDRRRTITWFRKSLETTGNEGLSQSEVKSSGSEKASESVDRGKPQTVNVSSNVTVDNVARKLRHFTGKAPSNAGETDFKRWRRSAMSIAMDPELTTNRKRTYLLQSLTGPAEDAVELVRDKSPIEIIQFLKSLYGNVEDGHNKLADFYQIMQGPQQSSSEYLIQLYQKLCDVVASKVIKETEVSLYLIRQFLRGTHDDNLVTKLRLDEMIQKPVDFPDLVEKVRKEEIIRSLRKTRAQKTARSNVTCEISESIQSEKVEMKDSKDDEIARLRKQIADLEVVSAVTCHVNANKPTFPKFCYRCGEDKHVAYDCRNKPNPELVKSKSEQRKSYYNSRLN